MVTEPAQTWYVERWAEPVSSNQMYPAWMATAKLSHFATPSFSMFRTMAVNLVCSQVQRCIYECGCFLEPIWILNSVSIWLIIKLTKIQHVLTSYECIPSDSRTDS